MHDPLADAISLVAAHRHREALACLEHAGAATGEIRLLRAAAANGLECFAAAHSLCQGLWQDAGQNPAVRLQAKALAASLLLRQGSGVDEAIEMALDVVAEAPMLTGVSVERRREWVGLAQLELVHATVRKGAPATARRWLQAAHQTLGDDGRVLFAAGRAALAADARADARQHFQRALTTGAEGSRLGHLGLAMVDGLVGDFVAAHAQLDAVAPRGSDDREVLRMRLRLLQAQERLPEALAVLDELLAGSPDADTAAADRHARAVACYRLGDHVRANAAWQEVVVRHAGQPAGAMARRYLARLQRPAVAPVRRHRLPAFPTVAQLQNHCGPAAVELLLRFFGLPAEQVAVARAVQTNAGGTPVLRLRRHLDEAGFVTRRIEADLDCLRRLLDAGLPVIIEEDYSASRHVAVAIGYDDALELLLVQDPMSHELRETPYEQLGALRGFSNHGALVAVPMAEAARLDAAGAIESRSIALVDEAWAATAAGAHERADQLIDEAIALRTDHELAWLHRFRRAHGLATAAGAADGPARQQLRQLVAQIVALWPDDEWPQQLVGDVACLDQRFSDALRAYDAARRRDPADARNWVCLADCHLLAGRDEEAHAALSEALRRNPAHARANQAQAAQYLRLGRTSLATAINEVAREQAPQNAFNHSTHAMIRAEVGDFDGALAAWQAALTLLPNHLPFAVERARVLARGGRVDEAVAALTACVRDRPNEPALRVDLAELLYRHGRNGEAIAACEQLRALVPSHASAHAIAGASLCASGQLDQGLAELQQALRLQPTFTWAMTELGEHLGRAGRHGEAVFTVAAAFGLSSLPKHELGLAQRLAAAGATADACRRARRALASGRLVGDEWSRAIDLVVAGEGVAAAHELLNTLSERGPRPDLLRAHARLLVETCWFPEAAQNVLRRLGTVCPDDVLAQAAFARAMLAAGNVAHGLPLLRAAVAKAPQLLAPRRWLAMSLIDGGLPAEALLVLQPCPTSFIDGDLRVQALLRIDRRTEAEAIIAGLARAVVAGSQQELALAVPRLRLAKHLGEWTTALALAEQLARGSGERDDDGLLGEWELAKFECLLQLGELERAVHFAERQATNAAAAARLSRTAAELQQPAVAAYFETLALQHDPQDPAVHALLAVVRPQCEAPVAAASTVRH